MPTTLIHLGRKLLQLIEWVRQHRWIQLVFNILLILLLVVFVGSYLLRDWDQLAQLSLTVNFQLIALCFLYFGLNYVLFSIGWHVLFKAYNSRVGWWDNLLFYSYSYLMRFLPTPIWFFTSRAVLYEKVGTGKRIAVLTAVMETFLHVISGLSFYCFLLIDLQSPLSVLPFLISLVPLMFAILRPDVFQHQALTGKQQSDSFLRSKDILIILVLYTITWGVAAPFYSAVISSIVPDISLTLIDLWKVWILSSLIAYLSSYTLGGIGMLREFSMTLLLSNWVPPPIALMITAMLRVVMTLAGILWALVAIGIVKLLKSFVRT